MSTKPLRCMVPAVALLALVACSKTTPPAAETNAPTTAAEPPDAQSLAAREADLKKREAELANRESALAASHAQAPAPQAPAPQASAQQPPVARNSSPNPSAKPSAPSVANRAETAANAKPVAAPSPPSVPAKPLIVPEGTQLSLALAQEVSTKDAKVGDTIRATVAADVRVDDKVAIAAGTTVAGQITDVVSGSSKIGGVPRLGMSFDRLELPGNRDVPIAGVVTERGKSDTARDTVKIVGGAAAGAILGHQVKGGDKGKVIGGLLGGAIGAVAAQKTGTEVKLAAGTQLSISLSSPVEIPR
ncbi:MAG: glycine zipper 2TM domain-containing protein [Steroidobacteraceae bacterium]